MPDIVWQLGVLVALVFVVNLVPAFMPSTWMILAFFRIKYGLPLLLLGILGPIVSVAGRIVLAKASEVFAHRFMKSKDSELHKLGEFLNRHRRHVGAATFVYTLTPLPTNNLFIAAGIARVQIIWVVVGFLLGRFIADTFWVWTTDKVFTGLGSIFSSTFQSWLGILLQVLSILSVALLFKLPWARWLREKFDDTATPAPANASPRA